MNKLMIRALSLAFGFFFLHAADDGSSQKLQVLVKDQSFAFFDLGLSENEMQQLQNLIINRASYINNYGHVDTLESEIIDFLQSLGNTEENAQAASKIIHKVVMYGISACDAQTGWITLRASKPNKFFDISRWHTDGSYYKAHELIHYKLAYALQGPTTLFMDVPDHVRNEFLCMQKNMGKNAIDIENRIKLGELFKDYDVCPAPKNKGIIFITGDQNRAAIHAEPSIDENRIFMSIVPGTHEQIQEWYENQKSTQK